MSEQSDQKKLQEEIIKLSESKDWESAKQEWEIDHIWWNKSHCLCNHDITQNIRIANTINGNKTIVGNVCINHFLGWDLSGVFSCLSRIKKDLDTPWNAPLALWLGYKNVFSKYELPIAITHCCGSLDTEKKNRSQEIRHDYNKRVLAQLTSE